jgi:hypothetical protein
MKMFFSHLTRYCNMSFSRCTGGAYFVYPIYAKRLLLFTWLATPCSLLGGLQKMSCRWCPFWKLSMWLIRALLLLAYTQQTLRVIGCWWKGAALPKQRRQCPNFCAEFTLTFVFAPMLTLWAELTISILTLQNRREIFCLHCLTGNTDTSKLWLHSTVDWNWV